MVVMWWSCGGHVVVMWWSCGGHDLFVCPLISSAAELCRLSERH